ncbi:MAG: response regulator transcription factor [Actinomycetota bacterium]|nr:response regulator transcription factor [Actinomycetota bacterium]
MALRPIVLLVDDDPVMRDMLSIAFSVHGGFRIAGVAADGFEAAMTASDLTPDVVILDCLMPRWDGEKAASFIRERCPDTKIIAFSAIATERPEWADKFLTKNDVELLIRTVEEMTAN